MKFLFGSVVLFFLFVIIVGIFSYFTLQEFWHSDAPDAVKSTAAATQQTITRSAESPNRITPATAAGKSAMTTSSMTLCVVRAL